MKQKQAFISNDVWIGLFLTILAAVFLAQAVGFPGESAYFPSAMLLALLVTSAGVLGLGIWKTVKVRKGKADYTNPELKARPFLIFLSVVAYVFCIDKIGFFVTSAVYLPCAMLLFGQRNWKVIVLSTVICVACLYLVFVGQLKIHMPAAILF